MKTWHEDGLQETSGSWGCAVTNTRCTWCGKPCKASPIKIKDAAKVDHSFHQKCHKNMVEFMTKP